MNLANLFTLFQKASDLCGHREYVVIGSLSVLGMAEHFEIPSQMSLSIDIDCYTRSDPGRIFDLKSSLGQDSPFHVANGYFLDPVSPGLPTLPDGWTSRVVEVERNGICIGFLDPNDAAVSKYARGEPRDMRWIRAGIASGLISLSHVKSRLRSTNFFDEAEEADARARIEADSHWFDELHAQRSGPKQPKKRDS